MQDPRTLPDWRTVLRYAALQLPGQLFVAGLGLAAWEWFGAPSWLAWGVPLAWVAKDAVLFPFVWRSYGSDEVASAGLLGQIAVSDETLDPSGWARLGPELWRVELVPGSSAVPRGAKVRVVGVDGLLLHVAPADAHFAGAEAGLPSSAARSSSTQSS
jgi:membrane protein implicated in regulation of membrane protease activity